MKISKGVFLRLFILRLKKMGKIIYRKWRPIQPRQCYHSLHETIRLNLVLVDNPNASWLAACSCAFLNRIYLLMVIYFVFTCIFIHIIIFPLISLQN